MNSRPVETIITIQMPFKRIPRHKFPKGFYVPRPYKYFGWLFTWGGGSIQEFGGSAINSTRHLTLFGWHVLTFKRNQYHDRSDAERAAEYLGKWSECEKELQGLRLIVMGEGMDAEVKKVIRDSLGVDLDEGRIL